MRYPLYSTVSVSLTWYNTEAATLRGELKSSSAASESEDATGPVPVSVPVLVPLLGEPFRELPPSEPDPDPDPELAVGASAAGARQQHRAGQQQHEGQYRHHEEEVEAVAEVVAEGGGVGLQRRHAQGGVIGCKIARSRSRSLSTLRARLLGLHVGLPALLSPSVSADGWVEGKG